ncbi:MAG: hypothetical protein DIU58_010635 [Sphaerobacter thermophilus]|uniref:hypothetical protein n=1 Tax=Sphaerobacter thermophilus TaxID=2057 RepID=UPI00396E165E
MSGVARAMAYRIDGTPAQRCVLLCLVALLLSGLAVRSLQSRADVLLYALLVISFAVSGIALLLEGGSRRGDGQDPIERLAAVALGVWLLTGVLVAWGLLLSAFAGHDVYVSLSWAVRLVPLALFPAFAFAFRTEHAWLRLLVGMVLLGTVSALLDIAAWFRSRETLIRLMSADFSSIDYFYALLAAMTLLLLVPLPRWMGLLLMASLPVLLFRMLLSVARAWYVIVAVVAAYSVVVAWRWLPRARRRMVLVGAAVVAALAGLVGSGLLGDAPMAYLAASVERFAVLDTSLRYRWAEVATAFAYGGPLGAGWGARGDFEEALLFTSASYYFAVKPYVHNFIAFMFWKLGLLGLGTVGLLAGYLVRQGWAAVRRRDPLGLAVLGLWLAWGIHSMVNMNFGRPELNVWAAAWLGYLEWRRLQTPAARPATPRPVVEAPPGGALEMGD